MSELSMKPNHVCKNANCKKGVDSNGKPCAKEYYACDYCDRMNNWKSLACSWECYCAFMEQVLEARGEKATVDKVYPNRTDMTKEELFTLYNTPIEEIKAKTEKELKPYLDKGMQITEAVDTINKEIEDTAFKKTNKKADK